MSLSLTHNLSLARITTVHSSGPKWPLFTLSTTASQQTHVDCALRGEQFILWCRTSRRRQRPGSSSNFEFELPVLNSSCAWACKSSEKVVLGPFKWNFVQVTSHRTVNGVVFYLVLYLSVTLSQSHANSLLAQPSTGEERSIAPGKWVKDNEKERGVRLLVNPPWRQIPSPCLCSLEWNYI